MPYALCPCRIWNMRTIPWYRWLSLFYPVTLVFLPALSSTCLSSNSPNTSSMNSINFCRISRNTFLEWPPPRMSLHHRQTLEFLHKSLLTSPTNFFISYHTSRKWIKTMYGSCHTIRTLFSMKTLPLVLSYHQLINVTTVSITTPPLMLKRTSVLTTIAAMTRMILLTLKMNFTNATWNLTLGVLLTFLIFFFFLYILTGQSRWKVVTPMVSQTNTASTITVPTPRWLTQKLCTFFSLSIFDFRNPIFTFFG